MLPQGISIQYIYNCHFKESLYNMYQPWRCTSSSWNNLHTFVCTVPSIAWESATTVGSVCPLKLPNFTQVSLSAEIGIVACALSGFCSLSLSKMICSAIQWHINRQWQFCLMASEHHKACSPSPFLPHFDSDLLTYHSMLWKACRRSGAAVHILTLSTFLSLTWPLIRPAR